MARPKYLESRSRGLSQGGSKTITSAASISFDEDCPNCGVPSSVSAVFGNGIGLVSSKVGRKQSPPPALALRGYPLRCLPDDFPRTGDAELFLDVGPMSFDRLFAQVELARNLVHIVPFADQLEDFQFPIR